MKNGFYQQYREPTRVYTKYQLLIADGNMEYVSQTKKYCSKCAVLKRQIVSWRVYYINLKFY
jgi:hypothetical protein